MGLFDSDFSFSGFLDKTKDTISDINSFLKSEEIEPLVKVGVEKIGNRTAAQVEASKPVVKTVVAPQPASSFSTSEVMKYALPAVGAIALIFVLKKL